MPTCASPSEDLRSRKYCAHVFCFRCSITQVSVCLWSNQRALNQLAKNLACEWAQDNIRTNSVAPWYIKTSLVEP
ncbi:tropinone reductase homolog At2g29260, chloroplastic-like [Vitis vinifera]|uniref:tropinone reductase homolog At2g29260, chloroplastic-like n=1 Tax=Vitis vinifera TaxID=29760 RepID=UPI002882F107|nr:tropinone reductase homolog At2g29260, chloroplastic-like [Vitis vinifera]